MIHNPDRPEDVLKVDAEEGDVLTGDDPYDMLRYRLMARPLPSEASEAKPQYKTEEWFKLEATKMEKAAEDHFSKQQESKDDWEKWT